MGGQLYSVGSGQNGNLVLLAQNAKTASGVLNVQCSEMKLELDPLI